MSRRLLPVAGLVVCAAVATTTVTATGSAGADPGGRDPRDHRVAMRGPQTSDGRPGRIAPFVPAALRGPAVITSDVSWPVVPGVAFRQWEQTDARGPIRASLLTLDPATPGLVIDYASMPSVSRPATVRRLIASDHAIAGVNGDFYDIGDTQAPLGLGVDRRRGLLHARQEGWNQAFYIKDGVPGIADLPLTAHVVQKPWIRIQHLNSPTVFDGEIGVYDYRWGKAMGSRVVDDQEERVRQVVIRRNRVVYSKPVLTEGHKVTGTVLIGRGVGADKLGALHVGDKARVTWSLAGDPDMAISGNRILLQDGGRRVVDDLELHPRTAIGIDRDTGQVLVLAIDGRNSGSRGYTMVELALLMRALGAEDALNLDGGGSTTMLALDQLGQLGVRNTPSDGFERKVANALSIAFVH